MELTINQVKDKLLKRQMLSLLVDDYEYGMAMDSFESRDNNYFQEPLEDRAKDIAKHIEHIMHNTLEWQILDILKDNERMKEDN